MELLSDRQDMVDSESYNQNDYSICFDSRVMPCKSKLMGFLNSKSSVIERQVGQPETNIIDTQSGKCYYFDPLSDDVYVFFHMIWECYNQNIILMFIEKQNPKGSGIMLDFDFKLSNAKKMGQITGIHRMKLIKRIIKILNEYFNLTEYLKESKIIKVGVTSSKVSNNFHLLIPGIFLTRGEKIFLINKIINTEILSKIFEDLECISPPKCPLDINSKHVPVFLIGNTRYVEENGERKIKPPYTITHLYDVGIDSEGIEAIEVTNLLDVDSINFSLEFSLLFENPQNNRLIKKMKVNCKPNYSKAIDSVENKIGRHKSYINYMEEIDSSLSLLKVVDPEIEYMQLMLDTLAEWRSQLYSEWFKIIGILASMGNDYKTLAIYFSIKCPEKYLKDSFDAKWTNAVERRYYESKDRAMATLQYYARIDNPEKYEKLKSNYIMSFLFKLIYDITVEGSLEHDHIAKLLHRMLRYKFAMSKPVESRNYVWYEFMFEKDKITKGEIYKWRVFNAEGAPSSFEKYITEQLGNLFTKILCGLINSRIKIPEGASEQQSKQYIKNNAIIINNFRKTCKMIHRDQFIRSVVNRCRPYFDIPGFSESLNKDPMIFGVGNGVLELKNNGEIKLIQGFHEHKISSFTATNYKKFNPDDENTDYLLRKIRHMFRDERPDSFNWFMHWLGSTLDGRKKPQLLLILWGYGNNGKTVITDLYNQTFGEKYCSPIASELITRITGGAENATPVLMTIKNKHLVIFSELGEKETLNVQVLKRLLGNENIIGRELHKSTEQFRPKCAYVMLCNTKPDIPTPEEATWKRLKLINLVFQFYSKKSQYYDANDPYKKEADIRLENIHSDQDILESFLSIVSFYWQSLQINYNGKLENVPHPHIMNDTEEYRTQQDTVSNFISMRLVSTNKKTMTYISEIVQKYREWYESKYRISDKLQKKDMTEIFRNSKIGKYLKKSREGEFMEGMRFLRPSESREKNEKFVFSVNFNDTEIGNNSEESDSDPEEEYKKKSNDILQNNYLEDINVIPENIEETIRRIKMEHLRMQKYLDEYGKSEVCEEDVAYRNKKRAEEMEQNLINYQRTRREHEQSKDVYETMSNDDSDGYLTAESSSSGSLEFSD